MSAFSSAQSGRAAAIARRHALSAGKAALPQAADRMRSGLRSAAVPQAPAASDTALPKPAPAAPAPVAASTAAAVNSVGSLGGRLLSMLRRRQMSAGKQSLPVAAAVSSSAAATLPATTPSNPAPSYAFAAPDMGNSASSGREQARARRAELSRNGRGNAAPAQPSRPVRQDPPASLIKVNESPVSGGGQVTGSRIGRGRQVTGHEPGATLPISGTQYIVANGDAAVCAGGPKVGLARTAGGLLVSGTLVRSKVQVTGDEAGASVTITGEADQRPGDDLTPRSDGGVYGAGQFQRQTNPHGHTAFGNNLARSAQTVGSRERMLQPALEATDGGMSITGSALGLGRTLRVTGDEDGACRHVTGDQYLTQARRQAERSRSGGGSAPRQQMCAARRDLASGAQVGVAQTPSGQHVSGGYVEPNPRVTGDESGSCLLIITGTPYHGAGMVHALSDPAQRQPAGQRPRAGRSSVAVSGDTPLHDSHDSHVTGTARGAARAISGTPYCPDVSERSAQSTQMPAPVDPVALVDSRFSVASPQRSAHLRADPSAVQAPSAAGRITGSFAVGQDKITGNIEFLFKPRQAADAGAGTKRACISGEGRTEGRTITGAAWSEQSNVTGTEGYIATERNPSQRAGKPHAFAGAGRFKALAKHEEPKQLVSGMVGGGMSQSAARVTLSGGAQA